MVVQEVRGEYETLFAQVVTIDVIASNVWLAVLIFIIKAKLPVVDGWLGGDTRFIEGLKEKLSTIAMKNQRVRAPTIVSQPWAAFPSTPQENSSILRNFQERNVAAISCGQVASFLDLVNIASVGFFTMAAATYGAAYLAPFLLVRMMQFDN